MAGAAAEQADRSPVAAARPDTTLREPCAAPYDTLREPGADHVRTRRAEEQSEDGPVVCWPRGGVDTTPYYKTRQPFRPHSQTSDRGYHPKLGFRVFDHETVCVPARDKVRRTRRGLSRRSAGAEVVYAASQWTALEMDAEGLLRLMREKVPANQKVWTLHKMEKTFSEAMGRKGCWTRLGLSFEEYLALFPKTFEVAGAAGGHYLRAIHATMSRAADKCEDVMIRLALARRGGRVDSLPCCEETGGRMVALVEREESARAASALAGFGDVDETGAPRTWSASRVSSATPSASGTPRQQGLRHTRIKAIYRPASAPSPTRASNAPLGGLPRPPRPQSGPQQGHYRRPVARR